MPSQEKIDINIDKESISTSEKVVKATDIAFKVTRKHIDSDKKTLADYKSSNFIGPLEKRIDEFSLFLKDLREKKFDLYRVVSETGPDHVGMIKDPFSGKSKKMIMLTSSNYLGFSNNEEVKNTVKEALQKYGILSGGTHMLSGTMAVHRKLENDLSEFFGFEDTMLFSTGYSTNLGIISALMGTNDVIILDKLCHASIIDGARLSNAKIKLFPHSNIDLLEKKLQSCDENQGIMVAVDGVYSMEADLAPLKEIVELKKQYNFTLLVDDAHGVGVIGKSGRGTLSYFDVKGVDLFMGTLSKSLGGYGGFISGTKKTIDYIKYYARSAMFSTNLPPALVAGCSTSIEILKREGDHLISELHKRVHFFRDKLKNAGITLKGHRDIPIIIIPVGDDILIRKINRELHEGGIFVNAIPTPAVPPKDSLIRVRVSLRHTFDELDFAANSIIEIFEKFNLIKSGV